ncbi:MAG TPA: hypothetical protein VGG16_22550 [Streptosporangiaceae bacterium]
MIDEAALRRMSPQERQELARALAAIDLPHPMIDPKVLRRRRVGLLFLSSVCLVLGAWIGILAVNLPLTFKIDHWRVVWVGLDALELAGFAATVWASWKQRQVIIPCMLVTGTLLICDAWFDIVLNAGTPDITMSILAAVFAEFPLAFLLFAGARRLIRITFETVMRLEGVPGPLPPLWRVPLFADGLAEALPARLRDAMDTSQQERPSRLEGHEQ